MAKPITTGTVLYEIKVTNPNLIANFDVGKLTKAVGDDLVRFNKKGVQGVVVKGADATKIVAQVKADLAGKKVKTPHLRAGVSGKDLIFQVIDTADAKYEKTCVLVADFVGLKERLKKEAGAVVNLDPGDRVIDQAAKDMAKKMGAKPVTAPAANFGITGNTAIVLLAHGDEDKNSTGQLYGKDFAGKQPAEIVKLLLDNPDPKKRLSPDYAGTIYLDGCFTAQGSAMQNYTKQVWDLLKGRGLTKASVKGNLGLAATTKKGDEVITTTEADERDQKLRKQLDGERKLKLAAINKKYNALYVAKYKAKNDIAGLKKDPEAIKLQAEANALQVEIDKKYKAEAKKIPGLNVKNFVGQFGLEVLN
jgi:hypothetical protein